MRGVGQRDVVHLDVLAGRDVALAQRHVALDHVGERVELVGRDAAHRQLDADHLHVGLALAVDALLEAELDEVVLLELALEEAGRLGVEVVELALEDRDHVPRDVLEHLGVLERAGASGMVVCSGALQRGGLHRVLPVAEQGIVGRYWQWSNASRRCWYRRGWGARGWDPGR